MKISLVIPLYNEQELIAELVQRSIAALKGMTDDFEILFVDDGSHDLTLRRLLEHRSAEPRIKVLELSKNFGHQAAFTAGLTLAKGEFVAMMDGDLQDPPEKIREMFGMLQSGDYDVINAKRTNRVDFRSRNLQALLFHKSFNRMSGLSDMDKTGNFSMMNRAALSALLQFSETTRYMPGLRSYIGYRQGFIVYNRDERLRGKSKMKWSKLLGLSSDAIFSFSKLPIRICLYLGLTGIIVFFLAGIYTLIAKIAGFAIIGWSSTLLSIYFLGSIQLTFLGVLGEYIYRIYKEIQRRPLYLVRKFHE
jgi:dolichol-phosphate mannosyltransferase